MDSSLEESNCMSLDDHHITLALRHLLSNALKFTPAGGSVDVRVLPILAGGAVRRGVRVEIHDTGIGISPVSSTLYLGREYIDSI